MCVLTWHSSGGLHGRWISSTTRSRCRDWTRSLTAFASSTCWAPTFTAGSKPPLTRSFSLVRAAVVLPATTLCTLRGTKVPIYVPLLDALHDYTHRHSTRTTAALSS